MDTLTLCASFVITRLQLSLSLITVKEALSELLLASPNDSLLHSTIGRFRQHKNLIPTLGSWVSHGANAKLTEAEVLLLVEHEKIQIFASAVQISPVDAVKILAETIPMIVEKSVRKI